MQGSQIGRRVATPLEYRRGDVGAPGIMWRRNIAADTVLFEDHTVTEHTIPGAVVRPRRNDDRIFEHQVEPVGDYVLELWGEILATGGFLLHYNMPFADLYMEVNRDSWGRGYGSFLLYRQNLFPSRLRTGASFMLTFTEKASGVSCWLTEAGSIRRVGSRRRGCW
jgi:hypothetical protein